VTPDLDRLFQALGDPTRRAIVDRLAEGPASVSRLAEPLGVTVTAIAQHLQVLEQCGVVRTEKVGRVRTASLLPDGLTPVERWARDRRSMLEKRLDRLAEILGEGDQAVTLSTDAS
jgi:DNA-binding transcriptional ArsR family regulator